MNETVTLKIIKIKRTIVTAFLVVKFILANILSKRGMTNSTQTTARIPQQQEKKRLTLPPKDKKELP